MALPVVSPLLRLCNDADGTAESHFLFVRYSVTATENAHHGSGSIPGSSLFHSADISPHKVKGYQKSEVVLPSADVLLSDALPDR